MSRHKNVGNMDTLTGLLQPCVLHMVSPRLVRCSGNSLIQTISPAQNITLFTSYPHLPDTIASMQLL